MRHKPKGDVAPVKDLSKRSSWGRRRRKVTYWVHDQNWEHPDGRLYWHGSKLGWLRGRDCYKGRFSSSQKWCKSKRNAMKHAKRIKKLGGVGTFDQNFRINGVRCQRGYFFRGDER